ncbi:GntR family transcriptional regulator [Blautia schinkii]|nr:GntR family transcriptional regulator [Blautia schinkii]
MKRDIVLYERIYQLLRNKIECGILPAGSKLPSRADLCKEFQVSEKTVRHVLELLAEKNLIETQQRTRPVVIGPDLTKRDCDWMDQQAYTAMPKEIFQSGRLLCYPAIEKGIALCSKEDWEIPAAIVERMDVEHSTEFWRLSHRFWRFFLARNGNDLILRAVDSLGFFDWEPLPGSRELRKTYLNSLKNLVKASDRNGETIKLHYDDFSCLYGFGEHRYKMYADSPGRIDLYSLEQTLRSAEERYSRVYMDILGLIAIGRYLPGDKLPAQKELQKIYDVSSDTASKAIRVLQDWGVVTAKRGDGIYVALDLEGLRNVKIPQNMIGCHLRRFLDSMELLALTIDGVAEHAAAFISQEEAQSFLHKMDRLWNEEYLYQLTPIALLEFIKEHIQLAPLKEIYQVIVTNYHIGRSIPKLVRQEKNPKSTEIYEMGRSAVECLILGDRVLFTDKASAMLRQVYELVVRECKRLGYWEISEKVYESTALWSKSNFL